MPRLLLRALLLLGAALAAETAGAEGVGSALPALLRFEASPVLQVAPHALDQRSTGGEWGDSFDYSDSDSDDDDDVGVVISDKNGYAARQPLPLAKRWRLFPAAARGSFPRFANDGSFELELALPGQVFVHVLKEDPDYDAEMKLAGSGYGPSTLVGKVVAMANDPELLAAVSVEESATGWSVAASNLTIESAGELVVYVYTNVDHGSFLGSVVARGAGDVVVAKKVVPRSASKFAISSEGGGGVYLHSTLSISYTSMALKAVGSSSVYLHCSSSVTISKGTDMTVDGAGSITVNAKGFSTTQITSSVASGGDICFSSTRLSATVADISVARNGSTVIVTDHAFGSSLTIKICDGGAIDTGSLSSVHTSVEIQGSQDAEVIVGSSVSFEYSAPSESHVRYRGRGPRMVMSVAPGSPPLEKTSSKAKKCRAVAAPSELAAVSLVETQELEAASAPASARASSPSAPLSHATSSDVSGSSENQSPAHRGRAGADANHGVRIQYPGGEVFIPTNESDDSDDDGGYGAWLPFVSPYLTPPPRLSPSPSPLSPLPPSPLPIPTPLPTPSPTPSPIPLPTPSPTSSSTPIAASASPIPQPTRAIALAPPSPSPLPSELLRTSSPVLSPVTATGVAPATNSTLPGTPSSGRANALYFQLAMGFVAFIWLLHQILQCCDRSSRRRNYEAIDGRAPEEDPVLI